MVLLSPEGFSHKLSTAEAFPRVWSQKNICVKRYIVQNSFLGVNKVSSHANKTGPWNLLAILFKHPDEEPRPFRFLTGLWFFHGQTQVI